MTTETNEKKQSTADKIWENIKDVRVEMFALPNQVVSRYCEPIAIEPSNCYLKFTTEVILPALELALKDKYDVERTDKYIKVSLHVNSI
jgi:hypothetical protein